MLKSTGSEFKGFLVDEFTTLPEADDRILATSLTAELAARPRRRATSTGTRRTTRCATLLLTTFADDVLAARCRRRSTPMGRAVLEAQPGIAEIPFSAPNKHHFLVDFSGSTSGWTTTARCSSPPTGPTA